MALTTEQIDVLYMRNGLGKFHQPVDSLQCEYDHCIHDFARAIEAEVRKDDEALIRHLVEALEYHRAQTRPIGRTDDAIATGRARLEGKP